MIIKEKQAFAHEVELPINAEKVIIYKEKICYSLHGTRYDVPNPYNLIPNQNNWTFENGILTF